MTQQITQRRKQMHYDASLRPSIDVATSVLLSEYNAYLNTLSVPGDMRDQLLAEYCDMVGIVTLPGTQGLGVSVEACKRWRQGRSLRNLCNSNAVTSYRREQSLARGIVFSLACFAMLVAGILFAIEVLE